MSATVPLTLDDWQALVGPWAVQTFPHASATSIGIHLAREVVELRAWAAAEGRGLGPVETDQLAEEAADCLLLLLHLAYRGDFSLDEAVQAKFAINQQRRWGTPDREGVVEHLDRAPAPAPPPAPTPAVLALLAQVMSETYSGANDELLLQAQGRAFRRLAAAWNALDPQAARQHDTAAWDALLAYDAALATLEGAEAQLDAETRRPGRTTTSLYPLVAARDAADRAWRETEEALRQTLRARRGLDPTTPVPARSGSTNETALLAEVAPLRAYRAAYATIKRLRGPQRPGLTAMQQVVLLNELATAEMALDAALRAIQQGA